jgi:hypothetical protein
LKRLQITAPIAGENRPGTDRGPIFSILFETFSSKQAARPIRSGKSWRIVLVSHLEALHRFKLR